MSSVSGHSSRKHSVKLNEIPDSMQFFKWARMGKLSDKAICKLQSYCFGEDEEVNEFMSNLMKYYRGQMQKEREYREKREATMKAAKKEEIENSQNVPLAKEDQDHPIHESSVEPTSSLVVSGRGCSKVPIDIPPEIKQEVIEESETVAPAVPEVPIIEESPLPDVHCERKHPVALVTLPDEEEVKILSKALVGLNRQIDFVNEVKERARELNLDSEFFMVEENHLISPSLYYTSNIFAGHLEVIMEVIERTEREFGNFNHSSIASLVERLETLKHKVTKIKEFAVEKIKIHRYTKKAKLKEERKKQETSGGKAQKRPENQASSPTDHPPAKKTKTALLPTPEPSGAELRTNTSKAKWFCAFCHCTHASERCHVFSTIDQRQEEMKEQNLCCHCLKKRDHSARDCPRYGVKCYHCRLHNSHVALCRILDKPAWNQKRPFSLLSDDDRRILRPRAPPNDITSFSQANIFENEEKKKRKKDFQRDNL